MLDLLIRRFILTFGALSIVLFSSCFCGLKWRKEPFPHKHHTRLGWEFITYSHNKTVGKTTSKGSRFFVGPRLSYESLSPNAPYFGVDLAFSTAFVDFKAYSETGRLNLQQSNRNFMSADMRLGYTFMNRRKTHLISPFLGVGNYSLFSMNRYKNDGLRYDIFTYLSAGAKYKCHVTSKIEIGCNLKILYVFNERLRFQFDHDKLKEINQLCGGEIGAPITWYLSKRKRWGLMIEPYLLALDFSSNQLTFGSRFLFSFNF